MAFQSWAANLVAGDGNAGRYEVDSSVIEGIDVFLRDLDTGTTERVSVSSSNEEAMGDSHLPSLSADGLVVAFASNARNLTQNDCNESDDVFVRDRVTGVTSCVSLGLGGGPGNGPSGAPAMSGDGRYVAFESRAPNLIEHDNNNAPDIFIYDLLLGVSVRASVGPNGEELPDGSLGPAISSDGCQVAFLNGDRVRVYDCRRGATSEVDTRAEQVAISGDGSLLLISESPFPDDPEVRPDALLIDLQSGSTTMVSHGPDGSAPNGRSGNPAISRDGRAVAFGSEATNLIDDDENGMVDVFVVRPVAENACDDSDACTEDRRTSAGCVHALLRGVENMGCALENAIVGCPIESLPAPVEKSIWHLVKLLDQVEHVAAGRRWPHLRQRATRTVRQAVARIRRAANPSRLSGPCADDLSDALRDVRTRLEDSSDLRG